MERFDMRAVLEEMPAGVQLILQDGEIVYSNAAAVDLLRLHHDHIAERGLYSDEWLVVDMNGEPVPQEDWPAARALATGEHARGVLGVVAGGVTTWLEIQAVPTKTKAGESSIIVTFLDVTERIRLQILKTQFVSNVSHELRTPLSPIYGYLSLMKDQLLGDLNPEQMHVVEVAFNQANRLLYLVNQVVVLRSEIPRRVFQPVGVGVLLREICDETRLLAKYEKGVTLKTGRIGRQLIVNGAALHLRHALMNLVDNAIKFTPEGGTVVLSAKRNNGEVIVEIADTGIGIPASEHDHIFEPFYQVNGHASRMHGGMGIGLAATLRIVEIHNGRIEVESEPGKGSTFKVWLPRLVAGGDSK